MDEGAVNTLAYNNPGDTLATLKERAVAEQRAQISQWAMLDGLRNEAQRHRTVASLLEALMSTPDYEARCAALAEVLSINERSRPPSAGQTEAKA